MPLSTSSFRRRWLPRLIACAIGGACATQAPAQTAPDLELDRIVAIVNDDVIAWSEFEARLRRVRDELRQSGTPLPPQEGLRRQVLERLILLRIQLQLARDAGIRIGDERLNQTLLRIAEQNGLTLREFRDVLKRDGYDFAKFREEVREEIMISEIRKRRVENQVRISQRDIDNHLSTMERPGSGGGPASVPDRAHPDRGSRRSVIRGDRRGAGRRPGACWTRSEPERTSRPWR